LGNINGNGNDYSGTHGHVAATVEEHERVIDDGNAGRKE
jgi:hypothetical protein